MARWTLPNQSREQLILFAEKLDHAISPEHPVRLLDELLAQIDWSQFESEYATGSNLGRPPFHPRLLSSIILYGLITRIRASRKLEEALTIRLDFRWLAEGQHVDHTTLCEFRRKHPEHLKDLFVQIGLIAQQLGLVRLGEMAFDGTRVRASNQRHRSKTPQELRALKQELQATFETFLTEAEESERFEDGAAEPLPKELLDARRRGREIQAALAELDRIEAAGEDPPPRIPLTDPESRIGRNKEGGFAPNYTPIVGVDVASGLLVTGDVLSTTSEEHHLMESLEDVTASFGTIPEAVLADGLFATGANLEAMEKAGVTLYSPSGGPNLKQNSAVRDDPTQPVIPADYDELPIKQTKGGPQFSKEAFLYDAEEDCYRCPQGETLQPKSVSHRTRVDGTKVEITRYRAEKSVCAACPLKDRCLTGEKKLGREICRDQFETLREQHAEQMQGAKAQEAYTRRFAPGERPFAVIKQVMGARQFLLRGLERVRAEWLWLMTAFNLKRLMQGFVNVLRARPGPGEK